MTTLVRLSKAGYYADFICYLTLAAAIGRDRHEERNPRAVVIMDWRMRDRNRDLDLTRIWRASHYPP